MVHIVPVFGERGALLERWVFGLFYNWPLTIRRRMQRRTEIRAKLAPRYWHAGVCAFAAALVFAVADIVYMNKYAKLPGLGGIWWLVVAVPLLCGAVVTLGCGGAVLWRRIVTAAVTGVFVGVLATVAVAIISRGDEVAGSILVKLCAMHTFVSAILSVIGAVVTEMKLPDPDFEQLN
jgi:hypothetical protein